MTESSVLVLPFAASSVGTARRRLVSDLARAGSYGSAGGDAALVISELLSNALRHAQPVPGSNLRVAWRLDDGRVLISVTDDGARTRPELGTPSRSTTGGRGLRIVERLSRRWGAHSDDEGTTVWAEVPVRRLSAVAVPAAQGGMGGRRAPPRSGGVGGRLAGRYCGRVRLVDFNVSTRFHGDHTIVTISGEIDLYTAPRLHSEIAAVLADGMPARVVIDMSGVEFCDSTGMNVLLSCLRRARERGGELEIASPKPAIRKLLQVTGLDSVFTVVDGKPLGLSESRRA